MAEPYTTVRKALLTLVVPVLVPAPVSVKVSSFVRLPANPGQATGESGRTIVGYVKRADRSPMPAAAARVTVPTTSELLLIESSSMLPAVAGFRWRCWP
jgi:hypothetical protein